MSEQLKNCPFCGGEANLNYKWERDEAFTGYGVNCCKCPARNDEWLHKIDATAAWNTRAPSPDPRHDREHKLVEALRQIKDATTVSRDAVELKLIASDGLAEYEASKGDTK